MFDAIITIGLGGMLLILVAFLLNQTHVWKDTDFIYDFFNLLGGGLLVSYAGLINSWPFLLLNLVWAVFSLRDCYLDIKHGAKAHKHRGHIGHKRKH